MTRSAFNHSVSDAAARRQPSRRRPPVALGSRSVPAGVIEVEAHGDGWYLVAIGRAKGTKRFNITRGEAAELVRVLSERVLTADCPHEGGKR